MKYKAVCWSPQDADLKCEYREGEKCHLKGECTWKRILKANDQEDTE